MEIIGRQIDFGFATEAVRGVAEAAATKFLRKTTANVVPRNERVIDDTSFGRLEDADRVRSVRKWNEGNVEGILHVDPAGYLFLNLYGSVDSQLIDDGVYEHAFTLLQDIQHPTLTLFVKDGGVRNVKMAGGVVKSLKLTASTDNYVRFAAEFIGKEEAVATSTPSVDEELDFVGRDITLKFATTEVGLAAATAVKAKSLEIEWNPNVISDYVFGSYSPDDNYNGAFALSFKFTRNYGDQTFEDLYKSDAFRYCLIEIRGERVLSDSSSNPLIQLVMHKVQITDWNRGGNANELVTEEVSCKAFFNADDDKQSELTLVNETASYAAGS